MWKCVRNCVSFGKNQQRSSLPPALHFFLAASLLHFGKVLKKISTFSDKPFPEASAPFPTPLIGQERRQLPILVPAFLVGLIQSSLQILNLSDELAAFAVPFLTKQFKLTA